MLENLALVIEWLKTGTVCTLC